MFEHLVYVAQLMAELKQKEEERWRAEFSKADPTMRKIMMEAREKRRLEEIEERRHRENIRAQEKIADAIRASSFWRF